MHCLWQDVATKIRRDFLSTYMAELAFWPAFQTLNFWKVPVRHQLLTVNTACLLDATFLCWCSPVSPFSRHDFTLAGDWLPAHKPAGQCCQLRGTNSCLLWC